MRIAPLVLSLLLSLGGCSSEDPAPDGGRGPDAADAGGRDVGLTDSGLADLGNVDAGVGPDASESDAGPSDVAVDGGCPCTVIEDYLDRTQLDSALTNAEIDTSGTGFARVPAPRIFESPGTGADGAYQPLMDDTLAPGVHELSSLDIDGVTVDATGDLELRVNGPITIHNGGILTVTGNLRIIAGGEVLLDDGYINADGDVTVHQPGAEGIVISGPASPYSEIVTLNHSSSPGGTGRIEIWTRGALTLGPSGYLITGRVSDVNARSGTIEVRAYGDVILGPDDAYFISGDSAGQNGGIEIYTEGRLILDDNSYLIGGRGSLAAVGGDIVARARGRIELRRDSYFISAPGGAIDVITESDLLIQEDSNFITGNSGTPVIPPPIRVVARRVSLEPHPNNPTGGGGGIFTSSAGNVTIEALDGVALSGASYVGVGRGCPAGNVLLRTEGDISVLGTSFVSGGIGEMPAGTNCGPGGLVDLVAGGTITASAGADIVGGPGTLTGTVSMTSAADYQLGELNAGLATSSVATSIGFAIGGVLSSAELRETNPSSYGGARLQISPDGQVSSFQPVRYFENQPLPAGWRARLMLEARMFDGAAVDGYRVELR